MKYETIVCDRCGTEQKLESIDSWIGWHTDACVSASGVVTPYSGTPDVKWRGDLCRECSALVDETLRNVLRSDK